MTQKPLISIVIPTLNEAKYLPTLIRALKNQTFTNYEVIIVDKSSNDGTKQLCRHAGWQVVNQIGNTISAARGQGFSLARADIIASTDADSAPSPQWLETIFSVFSDPKVVGVHGPTYFLDQKFFYRFLSFLGLIFFFLNHVFKNDHFVGMNFAVRKSAYLQFGGFNPKLTTAEDMYISQQIKRFGKIVFDKNVTVYTSSRRLKKQKFGFFTHHLSNLIRFKLTGTASSDFKPIR